MDVNDYLSNFPEKIPVAVNVPIRGGEVQKYSAIALVTDPPEVELYFDPNALPDPGRIDTEADCLVFVETGEIVTLISSIEEAAGRDLLRITVHNVIQHEEKREFFRGPAGRLSLSCRRKGPGGGKPFAGKGVNISCGGVLMMVYQQVQKKEKLAMEIRVPEPVSKTLEADAVVLRINQVRKGFFSVAVRFTNMDSETCDDIMAFCFAEQRRMLREQVLTRDL
ncbi:hypothetical protein HNR65_003022 [Desulfosalsimonas propionicica]|uniref:PilZ domain-containing protein n=1 Tax=Desulfosalsimonas propionicica TaxID=332175 RepID=A0A7W0CBJ1_9BACT|nr:PilZ domain-containing protein [Desulfosalsimonas propionicica]MBA2882668.1 hypothetical protein [Desulfosalsimonas propionicica]